MKALFDTNILIDYLNGYEQARAEIAQFEHPMISFITWMEVMVGATNNEQTRIEGFLRKFNWVDIDADVARIAVQIRRDRRIKLPDAIIWACAKSQDALLVTRNIKDFPESSAEIRVPYQL
jgi:hypothetical protein